MSEFRVPAAAVAAAVALSLATPAQAAVTITNFTVTGPVVSGTFSLAFDDSTSAYSLSALNITLAGSSVAFDTSNSGIISLASIGRSDFEIGGLANGGVYSIGQAGVPPADDFAFAFVPSSVFQSVPLSYDTGGIINQANSVTITAVPEPSTWAMMLIGFGAIGWQLCRRKRSTSTFAQGGFNHAF
jgi:hypothetical protein